MRRSFRPPPLLNLLRRIHQDQRGAVSLETILIIGAIALPILIFLIKFGWPQVKDFFINNTRDLDHATENVKASGNP